jgi:hypothetical protein
VPPPPPPLNFEGTWWNAPAESESGWGLTVDHQDDVIFATWFTYDTNGKAMWLTMSAVRTGANTFAGALVRTTGPSLAANPFDPNQVQGIAVGNASLTFTDANNGTFAYALSGVTQSKPITRQVFGALPTCTFGSSENPALATNYQGNWWTTGGAESGWGIYFTHQGDIIFATWFTYDVDGTPLWLTATARRSGNGYSGDVIRTMGPAFNAVPFDSHSVIRSTVGSMTLNFADGNNATFAYTMTIGNPASSVSRFKPLTRLIFRAPGTICRERSRPAPDPGQGAPSMVADDPLGHQYRLGAGFTLDDDVPDHLLAAACERLHARQRESRTDARAGRQRGGKANFVEAVIDPHSGIGEREGGREQVRKQGQREKAMRDRGAERSRFRAHRIDMDPLRVVDRPGKEIDPLLVDGKPWRNADLFAHARTE